MARKSLIAKAQREPKFSARKVNRCPVVWRSRPCGRASAATCAASRCAASVSARSPTRGSSPASASHRGSRDAGTARGREHERMSMSDPLADMCTRIRNAVMAKHESVRVPASKVKRAIADVLQSEGFIASYAEEQDGSRSYLRLRLNYVSDQQAAIGGIRRVSRPGLRVYVNKREIPRCLRRTRRGDHEHLQRRDDRPGSLAAQRRRRSALLRLVAARKRGATRCPASARRPSRSPTASR